MRLSELTYLKKIIDDYGTISNIGLNDIHKCGSVQTQQLAQSLCTHCKQLRPIAKNPNLTAQFASFCLPNNLQEFF